MRKIVYRGVEYDMLVVSESPLTVTIQFDNDLAIPLMRIGEKWTVLDSTYLPSGASIDEIGKLIYESIDSNN